MRTQKAAICLEDGFYLAGESFGAPTEKTGEVVFNTSMSGYQEILTDPSYARQIVVMTASHVGNYGVNPEDVESGRIQVEAFCVREYSEIYSNYRATASLGEYLKEHDIPGVSGVDTRALTRRIRDRGAMRGVVSAIDTDPASLVSKAKASPLMTGANLADAVTCPEIHYYDEPDKARYRVVAYDFGIKTNILRLLRQPSSLPHKDHTPHQKVHHHRNLRITKIILEQPGCKQRRQSSQGGGGIRIGFTAPAQPLD